MLLDLFVSGLDGIQHHILGNFFRLAFDHHDIFLGGSDHELDVSLVHLAEARIDLELTINPGYSNLGDRSEEWNVAACKGSRRRKPCESIRLDVFLCRNQPYIHEYCKMKIIREQRPESPVHEPGDENLVV